MTPSSDRILVIQILKDNQWIDCHHTFDDPNVVRRIFSLIQTQFTDAQLRLCDKSGNEIDVAPYMKAPVSRSKRRIIRAL